MEKEHMTNEKKIRKEGQDLLKMRYFLFLFEYPSAEEWRSKRDRTNCHGFRTCSSFVRLLLGCEVERTLRAISPDSSENSVWLERSKVMIGNS